MSISVRQTDGQTHRQTVTLHMVACACLKHN